MSFCTYPGFEMSDTILKKTVYSTYADKIKIQVIMNLQNFQNALNLAAYTFFNYTISKSNTINCLS